MWFPVPGQAGPRSQKELGTHRPLNRGIRRQIPVVQSACWWGLARLPAG